ncbi:hypothetical protein LOK74_03950 [Brevibacillus humidisoli]|uniref:hypothetical protein n=1 Tax=Brevibacillus humidisoli TaxID=2895522 RepID=UPI001E349E81|nr:hypothetical protein [Brevibacillus humidisoli]UFJ41677.1 hypothetical protein LOK74_03950 [Brevibacillus humidisoli]
MYTVQPDWFDAVSRVAGRFQQEVEQLAGEFSLCIEAGEPTLGLRVGLLYQAQLECALWGAAGLVSIKGRLRGSQETADMDQPFPVTMRFSLACSPQCEADQWERRLAERIGRKAEIHWYIPPSTALAHLEVSLQFLYRPQTGMLREYAHDVLDTILGKPLTA